MIFSTSRPVSSSSCTGTVYIDSKQSVIRRRSVGNGFSEELSILNHADEPVDLTVRLEAASDFADLFEVKDALKKRDVRGPSRGQQANPQLPA